MAFFLCIEDNFFVEMPEPLNLISKPTPLDLTIGRMDDSDDYMCADLVLDGTELYTCICSKAYADFQVWILFCLEFDFFHILIPSIIFSSLCRFEVIYLAKH